YYNELKIERNIPTSMITRLSEKAINSENYRKIMITLSLNVLFKEYNYELTQRIISSANVIGVESGDEPFHNRLTSSNNETMYAFSTTSQISDLSLNIISSH